MSERSTITGLPVPVRERYVTRQQLADLMSVSVKTVDRMTTSGLPSVTFGRRTRRFWLPTALAWANAQVGSEHERKAS